VADSGVRLVLAAPDGPAESQLYRLIVFADEVEQASNLAEGESDQAMPSGSGGRFGALLFFVPF